MNSYLALILSAVGAFAITALLGYVIIPWLHKLKFGQTILDIGPKWHKKKQGTPTMGGLMFIIGIFCSAAVVLVCYSMTAGGAGLDSSEKTKLWAGLIMALMFGAVGFADDYIKVVKKRNLGLSIIQKTILQLIICAAYLTSLFLAMDKDPYMFIPFVGNVSLGIWFWILGVCVLYGAINAVNHGRHRLNVPRRTCCCDCIRFRLPDNPHIDRYYLLH